MANMAKNALFTENYKLSRQNIFSLRIIPIPLTQEIKSLKQAKSKNNEKANAIYGRCRLIGYCYESGSEK